VPAVTSAAIGAGKPGSGWQLNWIASLQSRRRFPSKLPPILRTVQRLLKTVAPDIRDSSRIVGKPSK
jgi:hypothetical protein